MGSYLAALLRAGQMTDLKLTPPPGSSRLLSRLTWASQILWRIAGSSPLQVALSAWIYYEDMKEQWDLSTDTHKLS
jgi:hypothetical protein